MRELQLQFVSNPVTVRWLRVLNVIEREGQFTIVNLSKKLNVSQRTLVSDIGYLKTYFKNSARFTYQKNRYTFVETHRLIYQEKNKLYWSQRFFLKSLAIFFMGNEKRLRTYHPFTTTRRVLYGGF